MGKAVLSKNRKLVIVGNGFDLAHGLKTGYSNFLMDYLSSAVDQFNLDGQFDDELILITKGTVIESSDNLMNRILTSDGLKVKSSLLRHLISNLSHRWVDIEYEYYEFLKKEFYEFSKNEYRGYNIPKEINKKVNRSEVNRINKEFQKLKVYLEKYLFKATSNSPQRKRSIISIFDKIYNSIEHIYLENKSNPVHVLNFNYTNVFENYREPWMDVNYIHGQLKNNENPLIFGYGDESDEFYKVIEDNNMNEYLTYFKSFGYFRTNNYRNLLSFIESDKYDVIILGHSCGLSDRVMFKTIFENDNCEKIQTYYYQRNDSENDFFERTVEISRHFSDKSSMRKKLISYDKSDSF